MYIAKEVERGQGGVTQEKRLLGGFAGKEEFISSVYLCSCICAFGACHLAKLLVGKWEAGGSTCTLPIYALVQEKILSPSLLFPVQL